MIERQNILEHITFRNQGTLWSCPGGHPRLFNLLRLLTPLPKIARGWYLPFSILPAWNSNFHSQVSQISWNVCVTRHDWYSTHGGVETLHQAFAMPISQSGILYNKYNGPSVSFCKLLWSPCGIDVRGATIQVPYLIRCTVLWSPLFNRSKTLWH